MVPMSGCDIRFVFTLHSRDSTLQYKKCLHLWNNHGCNARKVISEVYASFVLQCTKRTLHASVLVYKFCPEKTGFNVYAEYTQLQLTFLALHNYLYIIIRCLQVCHFLCLLPIFNLWGGSTPPTPLVTAKKIRLNFFWNFDTKKSCGKSP